MRQNDFSNIDEHRKDVKDYCIQKILQLSEDLDIDFVILSPEHPTNFILSIQIQNKNGKEIAEKLAEKGIFLSYLEGKPSNSNSKILRLSFQMDTTVNDIDTFIQELRIILSSEKTNSLQK